MQPGKTMPVLQILVLFVQVWILVGNWIRENGKNPFPLLFSSPSIHFMLILEKNTS